MAIVAGILWVAILLGLLFRDWNDSKKANGIITLVFLGALAFITISAWVFSPHNLVPDNVWGGIVVGSWIGGTIATISSGVCYLTTS